MSSKTTKQKRLEYRRKSIDYSHHARRGEEEKDPIFILSSAEREAYHYLTLVSDRARAARADVVCISVPDVALMWIKDIKEFAAKAEACLKNNTLV